MKFKIRNGRRLLKGLPAWSSIKNKVRIAVDEVGNAVIETANESMLIRYTVEAISDGEPFDVSVEARPFRYVTGLQSGDLEVSMDLWEGGDHGAVMTFAEKERAYVYKDSMRNPEFPVRKSSPFKAPDIAGILGAPGSLAEKYPSHMEFSKADMAERLKRLFGVSDVVQIKFWQQKLSATNAELGITASCDTIIEHKFPGGARASLMVSQSFLTAVSNIRAHVREKWYFDPHEIRPMYSIEEYGYTTIERLISPAVFNYPEQ